MSLWMTWISGAGYRQAWFALSYIPLRPSALSTFASLMFLKNTQQLPLQGLCTCWALYLENPFPRWSHGPVPLITPSLATLRLQPTTGPLCGTPSHFSDVFTLPLGILRHASRLI